MQRIPTFSFFYSVLILKFLFGFRLGLSSYICFRFDEAPSAQLKLGLKKPPLPLSPSANWNAVFAIPLNPATNDYTQEPRGLKNKLLRTHP